MALDGAFLYAVKQELSSLIGGRIDKIYQPSRDEIIIAIRSEGSTRKVLFSSGANCARVHLTETAPENPKTPPMFCMLMRKHLGGGKLLSIRQDGLERILYFDFECMNEIGDMVEVTVAIEIMGRCSNIILISGEGRVIDAIRRVDAEMSRERMVLPGMTYTLPPKPEKISFLYSEKEEIREKLFSLHNNDLSKCLVSTFEGISPLFARECVDRASGRDMTLEDLDENTFDKLCDYIFSEREKLLSGKCSFTVLTDENNNLKDFCFTDIKQYGDLMTSKTFSTAGETLDKFYSERDNSNRLKQRSADMIKFLSNTSERISRKLALQKEELEDCNRKEELKLKGDLINANIWRLEKGQKKAVLENYYDENKEIEIALDERLSPSQNAQKYYSEYRKSVNAEIKLTELIEKGEKELIYIDSVLDSLMRSTTENEVLLLRQELAEQGYLRLKGGKQKPPKELPPMEFISSDGFKILVGRNNKQNDKLTLKTAEKTDIWLHTKDIPGSHVIICTEGNKVTDETITEAAILAAYHSKGKNSAQVPVDYVEVKFVKKPAGSKPGMVIFTNNRTLYVKPDEEIVGKLKRGNEK
ncbi:MAG: NFACT family protein [Oscillospiraceae bacterium]|nr:NFACT family protein [Oscillospiraceae bacterium]